MVHRDGTDTKDGDRNAAKRFVAQLRQAHPPLKFIVTAESLRANAPHMETLQDDALRSILGVKAGAQA